MLLYLKLGVLIALATCAQAVISGRASDAMCEAWFAARCQFAHVANDAILAEQLVDEEHRRLVAALHRERNQQFFVVNGARPAPAPHR